MTRVMLLWPACAIRVDVFNDILTVLIVFLEIYMYSQTQNIKWRWSLMGVVAYKSLDHNGSKFFLIRIWQLPRLKPCANADAMFYSCKSQFREKDPVIPFDKFPFFVLARNAIMLPHLTTQSSLLYLSTGCLWEVKNKGKFQTFSCKSGRCHLQEVVAYKRFQI